jgi:hypothetical protein
MADTSKIILGIIGILVVGGGIAFLTPEQLEKASTCNTNNVTGIFEKFSSTNVTAYWTVDGVTKQAVCSKGKWIPTIQWAKDNGIDTAKIMVNAINESEYTEDEVIIVTTDKSIIVDKTMQISVNDVRYNLTYIPKVVTKCICDKDTGCRIAECA